MIYILLKNKHVAISFLLYFILCFTLNMAYSDILLNSIYFIVHIPTCLIINSLMYKIIFNDLVLSRFLSKFDFSIFCFSNIIITSLSITLIPLVVIFFFQNHFYDFHFVGGLLFTQFMSINALYLLLFNVFKKNMPAFGISYLIAFIILDKSIYINSIMFYSLSSGFLLVSSFLLITKRDFLRGKYSGKETV